jgi:hypothetical protein
MVNIPRSNAFSKIKGGKLDLIPLVGYRKIIHALSKSQIGDKGTIAKDYRSGFC